MNTYYRILKFVRPYWRYIVLSIGCTILFALLNGLSVYLTIPLLDTLFSETSKTEVTNNQPSAVDRAANLLPDWVINIKEDVTNAFNNFVFSGDKTDALFKICLIVLFAFLGKNIFGYLQAYFLAHAEQGTMKDLRDRAYQHLHELPMSYFKQERVGNLISRITNDVNIVQASISTTFLNLIREPLTIIVFLAIALSISWKLTLLAFITLPFSALVIGWIGIRLRKYSSIIQAKMADITSVLQETISGVKIVKAFGMEKYENEKFKSETKSFFKMMLHIVRVRNASSPITEFLSVIVGVVIIYYGGVLVLQEHSIKASEFLGFLFAIFQLMPPIKELSGVNNKIQESSAAADRVFEIIDTPPLIKSIPGAKKINGFNNSISFENVSFHYDDSEELVLDDINFSVDKGKIIAFVGPSGGGKSTLVDLIPRFYDPTSGKILIDGIDIKEYNIQSLRTMMGIVTPLSLH